MAVGIKTEEVEVDVEDGERREGAANATNVKRKAITQEIVRTNELAT